MSEPQQEKSSFLGRFALLILFILGITLIVFHEPILDFLEDLFAPKDPREVIATLDEYSGDVNFKLPKTLLYKKAKQHLNLRDQDTLSTGSTSTAVINFKAGFKLEVLENSIIVIEQPSEGSDGSFRVTFLRGDFRVLTPGAAGKLIIAKDNVLQDAAGRKPQPIQVAVKPPPKPPELPPPPPIKKEVIEEIKKTVPKPPAPPPPKKDRESLSDDYIAQVIRQQTPFFNRCYAEHLRLNPNARGRINLAFTIDPTGQVSSVRLLGSTLKDARLEQCTMAVVERVRFKKFDGDPIIVNYPINFE